MFTTGIQDFVINRRSDLQLIDSDGDTVLDTLYVEGIGRFPLAQISRMVILGSEAETPESDTATITLATGSPVAQGDILTVAINFRSRKDSDFDSGTMQNYYLKPLVFQVKVSNASPSATNIAVDIATELNSVLATQDASSYFVDTVTPAAGVITIPFTTWFRYVDEMIINGPGGTDYGITAAIANTVGQEGHGLPSILHERIQSVNLGNNDPLYKPTTHVIDTATYTEIVFDYDHTSPSVGLESEINGLESDRARFSVFVNEAIVDDGTSSGTLFPLYDGTNTLYSLMYSGSILTETPNSPGTWDPSTAPTPTAADFELASKTGYLLQVL